VPSVRGVAGRLLLEDSTALGITEQRDRADPDRRSYSVEDSHVTTNVTMQTSAEEAEFIATKLRKIGLDRILYGSDMAALGNSPPRQGGAAFRAMLPLTEVEFGTIANSVAPYMR
jgi:hypothetical protein